MARDPFREALDSRRGSASGSVAESEEFQAMWSKMQEALMEVIEATIVVPEGALQKHASAAGKGNDKGGGGDAA